MDRKTDAFNNEKTFQVSVVTSAFGQQLVVMKIFQSHALIEALRLSH